MSRKETIKKIREAYLSMISQERDIEAHRYALKALIDKKITEEEAEKYLPPCISPSYIDIYKSKKEKRSRFLY